MFRKEVKERVLHRLNYHVLTEHAFTVQFGADKNQLLRINYIFRAPFFFSVSEANQRNTFMVKRAPSQHLLTEGLFSVEGVEEMFSQLDEWLSAIMQEENIDPQLETDLTKLKEQFFKNLGHHIKDEDRHFTKEEAQELTTRIDRLEEQLEEMASKQKKSETEIRNIKKTMNDAKSEANTLTKKRWIRVGGGKILNVLLSFGKSKEGQKLIGDFAGRLLGPGENHPPG